MKLVDWAKNSFIAGLVVLAPLIITILALQILSRWILRLVNPVVRETRLISLLANVELLAQIVAGVAIALVVVLLGAMANWSVGRRLFGTADRAVNLIPLAGAIYGAVRGVANSMAGGGTDFERVVLVEFPADDVYQIGFVTSRTPVRAAQPITDGDAYNVYVPGSPNPTAGRLLLIPEEQLIEVDLSVREGLSIVVTTGASSENGTDQLPDALPTEIEAAGT
jgi:uncharacterized membrane protein